MSVGKRLAVGDGRVLQRVDRRRRRHRDGAQVVVDRARGDEEILVDRILERVGRELHPLRRAAQRRRLVDHRVPLPSFQRTEVARAITRQLLDVLPEHSRRALATIEDRDLMPALERATHVVRPDEAGPTEDQDLLGRTRRRALRHEDPRVEHGGRAERRESAADEIAPVDHGRPVGGRYEKSARNTLRSVSTRGRAKAWQTTRGASQFGKRPVSLLRRPIDWTAVALVYPASDSTSATRGWRTAGRPACTARTDRSAQASRRIRAPWSSRLPR